MNADSLRISNNRETCARIRSLRESAGLSRLELAQRAGIGISTLYLIEDGLVDSRFSTMIKLCFALNVTPDRLLGLSRVV